MRERGRPTSPVNRPERPLPTARVEYALRGDDSLTEADVRELMQAYISVRSRRQRENGQGAPSNGNGGSTDDYKMAGTGRRS